MKKILLSIIFMIMLGLSACGTAPTALPTYTPVDMQPIYTAAKETAIAQATLDAPTATPTASATATFTLTPSPTDTPTITPSPTRITLSLEQDIAIYMINPIDQENCEYEVLPIPVAHGTTDDMLTDTRLAISYLLNTKSSVLGMLTNPLSTSDLQFSSIDLSGESMTITLTGVPSRYEDTCLNEQARAQLWATASRYITPAITIAIWVDSMLFDDFMLRG